MRREISALVDRQASWAKPLGERVQHWLTPRLAGRQPVKDALNGVWLGHPVHPAVTDIPVGAMTVAAMLDLAGHERAADLAIAAGIAGMTASAATGVADAVDAYGRPQVTATVHATIMAASLAAYARPSSCGSVRVVAGRSHGSSRSPATARSPPAPTSGAS